MRNGIFSSFSMKWLKRPHVNHIVTTLIYSDFLMVTARGFLSPILAVFIVEDITGGQIAVVGFATTIFWLVKSVIQIPVAMYADKHEGERDDFHLLVAGGIVTAIVPLLYFFFAHDVWHIYLLQAIDGAGHALLTPTYLAIFTRHIDKHRESTEWTMHSNAIGVGFAAAAGIGGVLADKFGFRVIFLMVAAVYSIGVLTLLLIRDEIDGKKDGDGLRLQLNAVRQKDRMHH